MTNYFFDQRFLHGGDYNPDQWLDYPEILKKDLAYMQKAHVNTVTLGVFAWSALEPTEGSISLTGLMNSLMRSMLWGQCHFGYPSGGRPQWLSQKYPEVNRTNAYGQNIPMAFAIIIAILHQSIAKKCGRSTQN